MQLEEYKKMSDVEDRMWYYRALHRNLARNLRGKFGIRILDAGCGTGGLLRNLRRTNPDWQLTGLDFSAVACELARDRAGCAVIEGSVTALAFPDASFDAIISSDVLCQIHRPVDALREFRRCLKPDGLLVLNLPAYQWMYSYHDRQVANVRRYSHREVNRLLRDEGFTIVRSTYWNTLLFPLAVMRRKVFPPTKSRSDVLLLPRTIEALFNGLMALEAGWLALGWKLPFGSSVLTVAQKSSDTARPHTS